MKTNHILFCTFNPNSRIIHIILVILVIGMMSEPVILAQPANSFSLGSIEAKSGEKVTGSIIVEKGIDKGTFIPVTIINGIKPGPVLTLLAGVHGTEYVPVITAQKLVNEIIPDELSGTLIVIHIANIPSFHGRSVYSSPIDHKNLNRNFPGKKDGTISERIAYTLSNEIMSKSDYFIDMHGGEFNERIVDYLYYCTGSPESELCQRSKMMALAMGNKYLIPFDYISYPDSLPSVYTDQEAFRRGAAAITLEWGDRGIVKTEEVEIALKGIKNVMKTIGMLEGTAFVNEHPIYLANEKSIECNYDGILYTFPDRGQYITQGTLIGYTTDYWGNVLEEYHSPLTGLVLSLKVAPSINKGEKVCSIAEILEKFEE